MQRRFRFADSRRHDDTFHGPAARPRARCRQPKSLPNWSLRNALRVVPRWYALCLFFPLDCLEGLEKAQAKKEVPVMQATVQKLEPEIGYLDSYLGFTIQERDGCYTATPKGWTGEILLAESLPTLRRKIWRWWYLIQ